MDKLAIVTSRFHPELSGGAEKLALDYAFLLKNFFQIEIYTSAAKDYITWKNELPLGTSSWEGIHIHRFPTEFPRRIKKMNSFLNKLLKKGEKVDATSEESFIEQQGPYVPSLCKEILAKESEFKCIILIGYLYYPIVHLTSLLKQKFILIPTFHDEPVLQLPIYKRIYTDSLNFGFNAPEEKELYIRHFKRFPKYHRIIGTYIDFPPIPVKKEASKSFCIQLTTIGRLDLSKGYDHIFTFLTSFKEKYPNIEWNLTCLGANHLPPNFIPDWVESPGYISESRKHEVLKETDIFLNPSPYESFSIATMESWTFKKPVLVNGNSEVMKGHCLRSKGGLFYLDEKDFSPILYYLIKNKEIRERMGENGYKYVSLNFSKSVIQEKLLEFVSETIKL